MTGGPSLPPRAARSRIVLLSLTRYGQECSCCVCAHVVRACLCPHCQNTCLRVAASRRKDNRQWIAICYDECARRSWSDRAYANEAIDFQAEADRIDANTLELALSMYRAMEVGVFASCAKFVSCVHVCYGAGRVTEEQEGRHRQRECTSEWQAKWPTGISAAECQYSRGLWQALLEWSQ